MSAPAFTSGPWNVQDDGQIWCDNHPIVEKLCSGPWGDVGVDFITGKEQLVHWWGTVATDEAKANARLIAAAPNLYEALRAIAETRWDVGAADACIVRIKTIALLALTDAGGQV